MGRSLKYQLDRRLRLLTEPEHKSLYSWAILEVDERGQVLGRDQIPWVWTLTFTATEVVLGDILNLKDGEKTEGRVDSWSERSQSRVIRCKMRPGDSHSDKDWFRRTTYKMFGTDRILQQFQLDITALDTEEEDEECRAWGFVAYEYRDIRTQSDDDMVGFNLQVKPATFARYAQRIAEGSADEIVLSVGMVSGFYSDWSPDVVTQDVKILAPGKEQAIELPVGVEFEPPRLGRVGEVRLYINTARVAKTLQSNETELPDEPRESLVRPDAALPQFADGIDPKTTALFVSLQKTGKWIIWLLVLLIVVTIWR